MEVGDVRMTAPANNWTLSTSGTGELVLTPQAAEVLGSADTAVQQAQALRDAILTGIVAQSGIAGGQVVQVKQGPPMVLVIQVPTA